MGVAMVRISESTLPGVGKKFTFDDTASGDRFVFLIHHSGRREVYQFKDGAADPTAVLSLSDDEARKAAAILGGAYFQPQTAEKLDVVLQGLVIEWYALEADAPLVGATLADTDLRRRTGVTVVAALRGDATHPNPGPDFTFAAGDTLVAVGTREQHERLKGFLRAE